jgi:hypothetical protein
VCVCDDLTCVKPKKKEKRNSLWERDSGALLSGLDASDIGGGEETVINTCKKRVSESLFPVEFAPLMIADLQVPFSR